MMKKKGLKRAGSKLSTLEPPPLSPLAVLAEEHSFTEEGFLKRPWTSPYTEAPVSLHIGPDEIVYHVPRQFLPIEWVKAGIEEQLYFPDVDAQTGHILVHYLYKEKYESPAINDGSASLQACTKLKAALLVYIATSNHELPRLQQLAVREIEEHGSDLHIFEILETIDSHFSELCPDSWVHEYLHQKARAAFEQDHTVFTSEVFLLNLNSAALVKFMARCAVNLYNERVSHTLHILGTLKERCRRIETQTQFAQYWPPSVVTREVEPDVDVVKSPVESPSDKCCATEGVEDAVKSEDFCTISCPTSESPDCEAACYSHKDTSEDSCVTFEQGTEEICYEPACEVPMEAVAEQEPAFPECVPDSPLLVACEPTCEPLEEEVAAVPTECNDSDCDSSFDFQPVACEPTCEPLEEEEEEVAAVPTECNISDCDASFDPERMDTYHIQEPAGSGCRFLASHTPGGSKWKNCKDCQDTFKQLVIPLSSALTPKGTRNS